MWNENYRSNFDYPRLAFDLGFTFDNNNSKKTFDRGKLCLIDIDKIILDRDVAAVERNIPVIVEFKLEEEQIKILDQNFVKLFRLSQLTAEYLIFCKKYLDNTVVILRNDLSKLKSENNELNSEVERLTNRIRQMEIVPCLETLASFKCEHCSKVFASEDYLMSHIKRRHDSKISTVSYEEETNKLELEIKELKERLNSNEKFVQYHIENKNEPHKFEENNSKFNELQQKFEIFKTQVETELKLFESQKQIQEKYEKLFEASFQNLKTVQSNELRDSKQDLHDNEKCDKRERRNSGTQTDVILEKREQQTNTSPKHERKNSLSPKKEFDMEKMKKEITFTTSQHITRVEGILEERLSGRLKKMENHFETFLNKLKEIELVQINNKQLIQNVELIRSKQVKKAQSAPELQISPKHHTPEEHFARPNIPRNKDVRPVKIRSDSSVPLPKPAERKSLRKTNEILIKKVESSYKDDDTESIELIERYKNPQVQKSRSSIKTESQSQPKSTSSKILQSDPIRTVDARKEVLNMLETEMQNIGVSPTWKALPKRSFQQAITVVKHHATLMKKTIPDFSTIKQKIVRNINKELGNRMKKKKSSVSYGPRKIKSQEKSSDIRKPAKHNIGKGKNTALQDNKQNISRYKLANVSRNTMYDTDTDIDSDILFEDVPTKVNAETNEKDLHKVSTKSFPQIVMKETVFGSKTLDDDKRSHERLKELKKSERIIENGKNCNKENEQEIEPTKVMPRNNMYGTDSDDESEINDGFAEKSNTKMAEEKSLNIDKPSLKTFSHTMSKESGVAYKSVVEELRSRTKTASDDDVSSSLGDEDMQSKPSNEELQTKSVLKNFPSVDSIPRKKVLFNLSFEKKEKFNTKMEGGSTTSVTSSVFDLPSFGGLNDKNKKKKSEKDSDISDWDISD